MRTSEVLNRAADLIEERGWTSGPFGWPGHDPDLDSPLCLEGGIMAALGMRAADDNDALVDVEACPAYRAVQSHLDTDQALYRFNDSRTATEVIEALRATALIEAAREEQEAAWSTYAESVTA